MCLGRPTWERLIVVYKNIPVRLGNVPDETGNTQAPQMLCYAIFSLSSSIVFCLFLHRRKKRPGTELTLSRLDARPRYQRNGNGKRRTNSVVNLVVHYILQHQQQQTRSKKESKQAARQDADCYTPPPQNREPSLLPIRVPPTPLP